MFVGNTMLLMCKDVPVLRINVNKGDYTVLNNELMPLFLKEGLKPIPDTPTDLIDSGWRVYTDALRELDRANNRLFDAWIRSRLLPIGRKNMAKIVEAFGVDRVDAEKVIYTCKGVSVTDNYWFKVDSSNDTWSNVNIRKVHLNEAISFAALHGQDVTLQTDTRTPEVTNQGIFAKAWKRIDGNLWLYKKSEGSGNHSIIEVSVSNILDRCNVRHVAYEIVSSGDYRESDCCRCKCIATDALCMETSHAFSTYCSRVGADFIKSVLRIDSDLALKMTIVDFLVANGDRHANNWGFYRDGDTGEVLSMHPIYDHNNAFGKLLMRDKTLQTKGLFNTNAFEAAKKAMEHVDFHFTAPIERSLFVTDEHYNVFMERANALGIKADLNEKPNWCRENAPAAIAKLSEDEMLEYMEPLWLDYVRNRYGAPKKLLERL